MYYEIDHQLKEVAQQAAQQSTLPTVSLFTYQDWHTAFGSSNAYSEVPKSCDNIHFNKLESYPKYLLGSLAIPTKHNFKIKKKVIFYIEKNKITFIDDSDFIKNILGRLMKSKVWENISLESFLADFFEELIANDLVYVEELENRISKLESAALNGDVPHFNHKTMEFRKELLAFHYYYSQLIDLAEALIENENEFFDPDKLKSLDIFIRRVDRLQNTIIMLREYATQVREEYQAQIDIKQNNTMRILTVVTSLFLPLTLIVGWYGMNFTVMPELKWKYGYPFVMIISIATIVICLWICKKKKFL